MEEKCNWFVGVDWLPKRHHVHALDAKGREVGEYAFPHNGEGLADMAAWLLKLTGAALDAIFLGIKAPHGPAAESLMERGFRVHAINPETARPLSRRLFAGRRQIRQPRRRGSHRCAMRQPRCFQALTPPDPVVVMSSPTNMPRRGFSIIGGSFRRQADQPACTRLSLSAPSNAIESAPSRRTSCPTSRARIPVVPETVEASKAHLETSRAARLAESNRQIAEAICHLALLTKAFAGDEEDAKISKFATRPYCDLLPGVGKVVLATLCAKACDAL